MQGLAKRPAGAALSVRTQRCCWRPSTLSRKRRSVQPISASLQSLLASAVSPPAMSNLTVALTFTPAVAATGGVVLGVAAATKWLLTGRILGISGLVRGLVSGDWKLWRVAFLLGLLGGGFVAGSITPAPSAAFDALPPTFTVARAALGGLLVGAGTSAGNGCTSGHGICGLARLSRRSLAAVATFMCAGAVAATLSGTAAALGVAPTPPPLAPFPPPGGLVANEGALLVATAVLSAAGLSALAGRGEGGARGRVAGALTELVTGLLFAFGLVFAQMTRPTKVAGFLAAAAPSWDPSLAFVMGGALLVTLPAFQWARRSWRAPLCGGSFSGPASSSVDARLVVGSAVFGLGWGLSGLCPGPALVTLAGAPSAQVASYVAAMAAGMALEGTLSRAIAGGGGGGSAPKQAAA